MVPLPHTGQKYSGSPRQEGWPEGQRREPSCCQRPLAVAGHLLLQPGLVPSSNNAAALTNRQRGGLGGPALREPAPAPEAGRLAEVGVAEWTRGKEYTYTRPSGLLERAMTGRGAGRGVCDLGQPSLLSGRQFCHSLNEVSRLRGESVRRSESVTSCSGWETQGINAGICPHRNGSDGRRAEYPRRDGFGGKAVARPRGSLPLSQPRRPRPSPQAPPSGPK